MVVTGVGWLQKAFYEPCPHFRGGLFDLAHNGFRNLKQEDFIMTPTSVSLNLDANS